MLNIPFLPWGLTQEDEGFWTDEQEWVLEQNLKINALIQYGPPAWGMGKWNLPAQLILGAYSVVIRTLLFADDQLENIQRGNSPVNTIWERLEQAGGNAKELFEQVYLKLQNETSIEISDTGEFSIQYYPDDDDFGVSFSHDACWESGCLLSKGHSGPHWPPLEGFDVTF